MRANGRCQKKFWPIWGKSRFGTKFESYCQNRKQGTIQIGLGIWILNHRFESYLLNRRQHTIQMTNMNLNPISHRCTRLIASARPPRMRYDHSGHHGQCGPTGDVKKSFGRSGESRDLARNLNRIAKTGSKVRSKSIWAFGSYLAPCFADKIQIGDLRSKCLNRCESYIRSCSGDKIQISCQIVTFSDRPIFFFGRPVVNIAHGGRSDVSAIDGDLAGANSEVHRWGIRFKLMLGIRILSCFLLCR